MALTLLIDYLSPQPQSQPSQSLKFMKNIDFDNFDEKKLDMLMEFDFETEFNITQDFMEEYIEDENKLESILISNGYYGLNSSEYKKYTQEVLYKKCN